MHVAVVDQFAENPQPGSSIGSLRGNVLVASEPTGDDWPTGGGAADKFGIQHGQTEETQATERPDTLEALHFEKALSAMLKDDRLRGIDAAMTSSSAAAGFPPVVECGRNPTVLDGIPGGLTARRRPVALHLHDDADRQHLLARGDSEERAVSKARFTLGQLGLKHRRLVQRLLAARASRAEILQQLMQRS
ncbi:hypothetical protein [uncultured Cardiobacterium sp.]|uniref:hypothetical protein n=1 Tax=uncultured Cardiobacterium sp. TaxID=417619 RepID=UPI0026160BC5|nr:hypothetical protein [uncultured Cardiobacterium sp.]